VKRIVKRTLGVLLLAGGYLGIHAALGGWPAVGYACGVLLVPLVGFAILWLLVSE